MNKLTDGINADDTFECRGVRWQVHPEYRKLLFDDTGLRLQQWLTDGNATIIKKGPHRVVYRVDLPAISFFVKHNTIPDARAWLRQLFRKSKAAREAQSATLVAHRGIRTVQPLAVGEKVRGKSKGSSFLITQSLDHTIQLNEYIETVLPTLESSYCARLRIRLAKALGKFIADLHIAGIMHKDLHCGNLLLEINEHGEPILYLIDLQDIRLGSPLNWQRSKANLVILNRWLLLRASRADRLRFWKEYLRQRQPAFILNHTSANENNRDTAARARIGSVEGACSLERATKSSNEHFWHRRTRRYRKANRYFRRVRSGSLQGHTVANFDRDLLDALLGDPNLPFQQAGTKLLKNSRSTTVAEFQKSIDGVTRTLVYKRFRSRHWRDPLAALFRWTPALRSWIYGHCLLERGLATARPLAVFHHTAFGITRDGYLLMEKVRAVGDLHEVLSALNQLEPATGRKALRMRVEQLALLIRELHQRRLAHRDLKATNILLLADNVQAGDARRSIGINSPFCFIDLVGVSRQRRLRRALRAKNLARLHASFWHDGRITRTDKLRFLRTYLQWGLRGKAGWKDWWRAIDKATQKKINKNKRNGRMLA